MSTLLSTQVEFDLSKTYLHGKGYKRNYFLSIKTYVFQSHVQLINNALQDGSMRHLSWIMAMCVKKGQGGSIWIPPGQNCEFTYKKWLHF